MRDKVGQHGRAPGVHINPLHIQKERGKAGVKHLGGGAKEQPVEHDGEEDVQLLINYARSCHVSK